MSEILDTLTAGVVVVVAAGVAAEAVAAKSVQVLPYRPLRNRLNRLRSKQVVS